MTPIAMPCSMLLAIRMFIVTLRSMLISHRPETTCRPKPSPMPIRGSSLPRNIAAKKPIVAPAPRAASTSPISPSGNPAYCFNSGGSSTIGVTFSIPNTPTSSSPSA